MGTITLRWVEGKMMVGSDSNGHSIVIGPSPDPEFRWTGVKPSDLLLMALASCSAYDVVEILTKQREPLEDLKVTCTGGQMDSPPYSFTNIQLRFLARGSVKPERLEKAIRLSMEKYCSVANTIKPTATITTSYEIL